MRSFVRRGGRLTAAQRRALADLWPRYGIDPERLSDLDLVFGRRAPRCLEIGFGNGDNLAALAGRRPEMDFLGIEVHEPGIGRLMGSLEARGIENVRVVRGDAVEVLSRHVPAESLSLVLLYFPDPWPKKRHHKRRIVDDGFAATVASRLEPGGRFRLATDWEDYAHRMREVLDAAPGLASLGGEDGFAPRPAERPETRFERRGLALGHRVRDLAYEKRGKRETSEPENCR